MPKLNDTQLVILSAAAARANGSVLPLPKSLKDDEKTLHVTLRRMLKSGLLAEQPATGRGTVWRDAEEGRLMLVIGEAGLRAIGSADDATAAPDTGESAKRPGKAAARATEAEPMPHPGARAGSKLALVIDLLQRQEGASIAEIIAATSWQAHSVRGAISGALKKKLGLAVLSEKMEGRGRVYRIGRG